MSGTSSKPTTHDVNQGASPEGEAPKNEKPFWERKTLSQLSNAEWESLCDGCGKCCLHKIEDARDHKTHYTNVACRLLNLVTCQCKNYPDRKRYVPDCVKLTADKVSRFYWLPSTCAYRLLGEGKPLPDWHPLITGDPESVHAAGQSVKGRIIAEHLAGPFSQHLVDWWD
jgi:uncharacterized cysteine cluster protein YcgN (CxxCxxCC family)